MTHSLCCLLSVTFTAHYSSVAINLFVCVFAKMAKTIAACPPLIAPLATSGAATNYPQYELLRAIVAVAAVIRSTRNAIITGSATSAAGRVYCLPLLLCEFAIFPYNVIFKYCRLLAAENGLNILNPELPISKNNLTPSKEFRL